MDSFIFIFAMFSLVNEIRALGMSLQKQPAKGLSIHNPVLEISEFKQEKVSAGVHFK